MILQCSIHLSVMFGQIHNIKSTLLCCVDRTDCGEKLEPIMVEAVAVERILTGTGISIGEVTYTMLYNFYLNAGPLLSLWF